MNPTVQLFLDADTHNTISCPSKLVHICQSFHLKDQRLILANALLASRNVTYIEV